MVLEPQTSPNAFPTKSCMHNPSSKRMKIYPFHGLGVGGYELVSFRQGGVHHNVPFSKNPFLEILQLLFLLFWKILHVLQFCLNCVKSWWFFKKAYLKSKCHLILFVLTCVLNVFTCVCPKLALKMHAFPHGFGCFGLCWCHAFFHFDFRKVRFGWLVLVGV